MTPSLRAYSDLIVKVGLNLRSGQRLLIIGPLASGGVALEAAPLVREVAASAYRAGARFVEAVWGDEPLQLVRFQHAPRDSFGEYSNGLPKALVEHVEAGHGVLSIYANDPEQLSGQPADLISAVQQASSRAVRPFRELISRNRTNWTVVASACAGWASRVFAELPSERQVPALWEAIGSLCRLDQPDPVAAWQTHLAALAARRDFLNQRQYAALKYTGPGTDLTIGLPESHVWVSGQSMSQSGILFAPNVPTEEVFTMPHKDRVDGVVRSTRPLSYGSTVIDDFTLRFEEGHVVHVSAERGEAVLRQLVDTDPGAGRLGEVALVPASSPVARSKRLFYCTLFDENAASHLALGSAYRFTLDGGDGMDEAAFERAGGNRSVVHVDFMIGSGELDIDGVRRDGSREALMRSGEWS